MCPSVSTAPPKDEVFAVVSAAAAALVSKGRFDLLRVPIRDILESYLDCSAGEGFFSVRWFGEHYTFSPMQSRIVEKLWAAWQARVPDVHQSRLLEDSESTSQHLKDLFKNHPAWETMIVSTAKGVFRLQSPSKK